MRTLRTNMHRQSQQFKLAALLDFYEANPQQNYSIVPHNNTLRTLITSPNENELAASPSQQSINFNAVDAIAKKTIGVFSNIVQQMKENRHRQKQPEVALPSQPKRQYEFYYKCLKDERQVSPSRGTSTKHIKQRATGIVHENHFRNISLNEPDARQRTQKNENTNYLNQNGIAKQQDPSGKCGPTRKKESEAFVQLDFSFEEISDKLDERKSIPTEEKKDPPIEIGIIDMNQQCIKDFPNNTKQIERQAQPQIKEDNKSFLTPQGLIPTTTSKEIFSSKNEENFLPIPYQPRFEVKRNNLSKLNALCINTVSGEEMRVQGAKKAESRIYEGQAPCDPKDIQIDFDLDLNFI